MPSPMSLLDAPLAVVDQLFASKESGHSRLSAIVQAVGEQLGESTFSHLALSDGATLERTERGRVVRWQCIVQDMKGPELFLGAYETRHVTKPSETALFCGLYRDVARVPRDHELVDTSRGSLTSERHSFVCVDIPAQNEWLRQRLSTDRPPRASRAASATVKSFLPLPERDGPHSTACVTKMYSADADEILLNDMLECVGVLSDVVVGEEDGTEDEQAPADRLAVLHVLGYRRLPHCNPLDISSSHMAEARQSLVDVLKGALGGDAVAAEYLLCHLVSRIHLRRDGLALGKFALNLFGVSADSVVKGALMRLLPLLQCLSHTLELRVDALNGAALVPARDHSTDRLLPAALQLAAGTQLVVDETTMSAGRLVEQGVRNVASLRALVDTQRLDYDFKFHSVQIETDVPTLVLSEGKSMLGADCSLPLTSEGTATAPTQLAALPNEQLDVWRSFLTRARFAEHNIPTGVQQLIQDAFVDLRQADASVNADNLHHLLLLTRLLSLTLGEKELSESTWKRTVALDKSRRSRMNL